MTDNIFEQMEKRYDTPDRIELANIILEQIKPEFQNTQTSTLLDYGSGTGLISLELSSLVNSVVLVDSSEQMLEVAEAKINSQKIKNAEVLNVDFTKEVPAVQVDIILISLVLLHVPNTNLLLENLYSILNPGGKLIIIDFDKNEKVNHPKIHNGFTHEEMEIYLSQIGFESIETETFHSGKNIFAKQNASMFMSMSLK